MKRTIMKTAYQVYGMILESMILFPIKLFNPFSLPKTDFNSTITMSIIRRSNRISTSTNRRSPRLSRCAYGSHFSYCSIPSKNNNRRRALKTKRTKQKTGEKHKNQILSSYEFLLYLLRDLD